MQLALNVSDLDAAAALYATLFDPHLGRTGDLDPEVVERSGDSGRAGVCALDEHELERRLGDRDLGVARPELGRRRCCYAVQDKVWVHDPDGAPWEVYTVLADAPASAGLRGDEQCCSTDATGRDVELGPSGVPVAATSPCC